MGVILYVILPKFLVIFVIMRTYSWEFMFPKFLVNMMTYGRVVHQ